MGQLNRVFFDTVYRRHTFLNPARLHGYAIGVRDVSLSKREAFQKILSLYLPKEKVNIFTGLEAPSRGYYGVVSFSPFTCGIAEIGTVCGAPNATERFVDGVVMAIMHRRSLFQYFQPKMAPDLFSQFGFTVDKDFYNANSAHNVSCFSAFTNPSDIASLRGSK